MYRTINDTVRRILFKMNSAPFVLTSGRIRKVLNSFKREEQAIRKSGLFFIIPHFEKESGPRGPLF